MRGAVPKMMSKLAHLGGCGADLILRRLETEPEVNFAVLGGENGTRTGEEREGGKKKKKKSDGKV